MVIVTGIENERKMVMKKTRCKFGLRCLLYVGILALWVSTPAAAASQQSEMTTMNTAFAAARNNLAIPPMDLSPAAAFKTASFGLG
jgi:hypothetical protein